MRARLRTLLLLAAVTLVGLSLLAVLAKRYRGLTELQSVEDVVPVPTPFASGAAPAAPAGDEDSVSEPPDPAEVAPEAGAGAEPKPATGGAPNTPEEPSPQAETAPAGEVEAAKLEAEARGFLAVRRMVVAFIREHERDFERFLDPQTGGLRHEMPQGTFEDMHRRGLVLSVKKYDVAKQHDIRLEDYVRWREAFLAWREGAAVSSAEGRWFAAHPEAAEGLDLGRLELFDAATDPRVRKSPED